MRLLDLKLQLDEATLDVGTLTQYSEEDPALAKLNNYWTISKITKAGLSLQNTEDPSTGLLQITNL